MEELVDVLNFLKKAVLSTFSQLVWLLGLLFVFGLALYLFARLTRITYMKSVGRKLDIIFTGWIGAPVHELGHAIFCLLFGHKILEMRLYSPNSTDGTLGYVNHAYNSNNVYHQVGNFFIGVGPIIFGAFVLSVAVYYLVPNKDEILFSIENHSQVLVEGIRGNYTEGVVAMGHTTLSTLKGLFNLDNFSNSRFWIFLYLAICVSSHMELSPSDIRGAAGGLISMIVLFLVVNMVILGLEVTGWNSMFGSQCEYVKIENYATGINRWVGISGALFVFASVISGVNFAASYLLLSVYNIASGRGLINPLW